MSRPPDALAVAIEAARAGGALALRSFGRRLKVETKADRTPVTAADRAAEETIRRVVRRAFPGDGYLGEEFGETGAAGAPRWIIDPIDGTKSFIRGIPFWGTLVAREVRGRITVGALVLPALGRLLWAARGRGAWMDGKRLRVSRHRGLRGAYLLNGDLDAFVQHGALGRIGAIARRAAIIRSLGDCSAYMWVAGGRAEAMIESSVSAWDVAAVKVIVEEAGGRLTDWRGRDAHRITNVVASNGRVHRAILRLLRPGGTRGD